MANPEVTASCPFCGRPSAAIRPVRGFAVFLCRPCDHQFCPLDEPGHVARQYDDHYFAGDPGGYADYLGEEAIQRISARHYCRVLDRRGVLPGRMLDIGCAAGFHGAEFRAAGWAVDGIEPNAAMATVAREQHGLQIVAPCIEDWQPAGTYDLISLFQVISHIREPAALLQQVRQGLAPGGMLLIETWDRRSLFARLSGRGWHELNPPSVLHWFSRKGLNHALARVGFQPIASGLPAKSIAAGRAAAMLRHSGGSALATLAATAARLVPATLVLPYFLGDAFWLLCRVNGQAGNR